MGQSTPQTLAGGAIYAPTLESGQTSVTLNPLIISTTGGPVILDIPEGVTVNINGINGSGRTGAQPAICVPVGATLVITGGGILNVTGGNAGDGERGSLVFALFDDKYGDGGGGAAPGIGGTGGIGGRGNWNTGDIIYGEIGASMGKVYVIGNVVVNAQKGKAGESKVNTAVFGGGDGGKEPQYAIGGGGKGGDSKDGYKDATESPYYNLTSGNGTLYKNSTTTINYKNYQGNNDTPRSDVNTMPTTVAGHTFLGYRIGESWVFDTNGLIKNDLTVFDGYSGDVIEYWITTLTLDMQNGINGTGSITATYGSNMPTGPDIVAPTRTGYTFVGYFSEQNGNGIKYYDQNMNSTHIWDIAHEGEIKLYAHWSINNYNVNYDVNGGDALTPDHKSVTYNTAYGELPTPTKTGYTFAGWYTQTTGGDAVSSSTIMGAADVTIHAHWTANTYTVTLDKQSGTGGTGSVTATYDSAMPSAEAPTRTGYTFGGYYTETNGGGTKYYNADMTSAHIWDIAAVQTLYAKWTANSYTVTLDADGGTDGTASVSATYDSAMPSATAPTKTGYNFSGYYYGETQYYNANMGSVRTWDRAEATTLQAHWTAKQCTVILDADAVVNTPGTASVNNVTYDQAMPTPEGLTAPTKTGYTFDGYYTGHDGNGTQYYTASMTSATNWHENTESNTTLYAKWTANTYTVTLDKQSGTGGTGSVTATYDSAMPSAEAPSKTGYTFGGYFTETNGSGTQYYNADMSSAHIWDIAADQTLYAKWTANSYTVTLDANGGTGGTASVSATYDSAMPSATAPTGTGYNFLGYYYNDTQYYDGSMNSVRAWDRAEATTLIAHWLPKQCTVILDADAVVTTPGTAYVNNVTYNQPMPTPEGLTAPTRTGYTFGGYYTGHDGSGTQYYTESMTSATDWLENTESETTLYAKWTANQYTVSFNARGGSPTPGDITVTYDEEYGSLSTPTRYGFSFNGWYTGETSGTQVTSSTTVHITDDQTLYAHWNPITTDYDSYSVIGDPRLRGNYFRSFYDSHVAYELPDGVTAYKGQADGQYLVLTKIEVTDNNKNILPKDVPVILVAEPSYIDAKTEKGPEPTTGVSIKEISLTTSEYDVAYDGTTGNMLIGTDVDIPVPNDSYLYYILSYGTVTKRLGFYKWPEGNTLSAHKAYVQQSPSSPAKALIFRFENEATGINDDAILDFADDASEPVIYNLNGIRLSKPQKGVNIINGKKVWVK